MEGYFLGGCGEEGGGVQFFKETEQLSCDMLLHELVRAVF